MILFAVDQQVGPLISEAAATGGHYVYDIPPEGYAELPSGPAGQTNQDCAYCSYGCSLSVQDRNVSS